MLTSIALALVPLLIYHAQTVTAAVYASDYHSLGKTKQFVGNVDVPGVLKQALDSCSYKNEIILIPTTEGHHLDPAYQTLGHLWKHGIAHVLVLTLAQPMCERIVQDLPGTCCIWSHPELPPYPTLAHGGWPVLSLSRMRIAARIVRFGYNLLFLDTDIIVFDNPYPYFKSVPLEDNNVMYNGHANNNANMGVVYIQNVRPDGPVAWALADAPDRSLRWMENMDFFRTKGWPRVHNFHHLLWEQSVFSDAFSSTVMGRPLVTRSFEFHEKEHNISWLQYHMTRGEPAVQTQKLRTPPHLKAMLGTAYMNLHWMNLNLPCTNGSWPLEFGGDPYPRPRGKYSQAWQQLITTESGNPIWPDPEAPGCSPFLVGHPSSQRGNVTRAAYEVVVNPSTSTAAAEGKDSGNTAGRATGRDYFASRGLLGDHDQQQQQAQPQRESGTNNSAATPPYVERLALSPPHWLFPVWWSTAGQDWDARVQPPRQIIGHILYMPNDKRVYKNALKQIYGHYNWTLASKALRGQIYFTSTPAQPIPRVLALHPRLMAVLACMSASQLQDILRAFVLMALSLGRAAAFPALPCQALTQQFFPSDPGRARSSVIPYWGAAVNGSCIWSPYMLEACLANHVGILPTEMDHMLTELLPGQGPAAALSEASQCSHVTDGVAVQAGHGNGQHRSASFGCIFHHDLNYTFAVQHQGSKATNISALTCMPDIWAKGLPSAAFQGLLLLKNHSLLLQDVAAAGVADAQVLYVGRVVRVLEPPIDVQEKYNVTEQRCWALDTKRPHRRLAGESRLHVGWYDEYDRVSEYDSDGQ